MRRRECIELNEAQLRSKLHLSTIITEPLTHLKCISNNTVSTIRTVSISVRPKQNLVNQAKVEGWYDAVTGTRNITELCTQVLHFPKSFWPHLHKEQGQRAETLEHLCRLWIRQYFLSEPCLKPVKSVVLYDQTQCRWVCAVIVKPQGCFSSLAEYWN